MHEQLLSGQATQAAIVMSLNELGQCEGPGTGEGRSGERKKNREKKRKRRKEYGLNRRR